MSFAGFLFICSSGKPCQIFGQLKSGNKSKLLRVECVQAGADHDYRVARISAVVESNITPPEMGLSPLVGLLQSLNILGAVSLAHPLKHDLKIFDEWVKVRQLWRRNRENPIKTKN